MIRQLIANFEAAGGRFLYLMLLPALLVGAALTAWRHRRRRDPLSLRRAAWVSFLDAAIAWTVLAMLVVGFWGYDPATGAQRRIQLIPLEEVLSVGDGETPWASLNLLLGNILLFMPIGLLLKLRAPALRVIWITAGAAAASTLVETLQFLLPSGRVSSVDDVLLNTTGATLGALAAAGLMRLARARRGGSDRSENA